jgi:hypothetical protein
MNKVNSANAKDVPPAAQPTADRQTDTEIPSEKDDLLDEAKETFPASDPISSENFE